MELALNIKHEITSSEQFTGMNETQEIILLIKKKNKNLSHLVDSEKCKPKIEK